MRSSIVGETRIHQGWLLVMLLLPAGCAAPPQPTPPPPLATAQPPAFAGAPAEQALPALVMAERQAAAEADLATLTQLWAAEARIVDGRGTPDTADDYIWAGRAALLDRYRLAVFPSPPPLLGDDDFAAAALSVNGDQAALQRNGDHWRFVYRDGRWWLLELAYN